MTTPPQPFGTYALSGWRARLLKTAQSLPANWLGRRLALLCRKIVLKSMKEAVIDAAVGPISLRFHTNDNVSERKFLFTPQFFDVFERDLIARELSPGGVFVDIGANAGIYSLWAAHHLDNAGRVIAVEPNPVMAARLIFNAMVNKTWGRIKLEKCGVAETEGQFILHLDDSNYGGASLLEAQSGQKIKIPCLPLKSILEKNGVTKVDILKIDIEGAEDTVLIPFFDAVPETLWPRILILENSPAQWRQDLKKTLAEKGYTLIRQTRMNLIYKR